MKQKLKLWVGGRGEKRQTEGSNQTNTITNINEV